MTPIRSRLFRSLVFAVFALTPPSQLLAEERSLDEDRKPTHPAALQVDPERTYDEPDSAALYARLKRQGPSPDFNTAEAHETALEHLDRMPRFSTAYRVPLPIRPGGGFRSLPKFAAARALGTWEPLGPGNIGGRTRTLVIHAVDSQIMYTGGVSGGVWKTTDGGRNWLPVSDRLTNIAVNSMAVHPDDPDVLYIGTGEGYFREIVRGTWLPLRGAGIYLTRDGGDSWKRLPATGTRDFHWVNDIVISPRQPERIFAATRTGVHISENGGETWRRLLDPEVNGGCLDLVLRTDLDSDVLFASCGTFEQASVWRREMNTGGFWERVLSDPGMGRTTLAIAPSDQNVIYALSASNDPGPNGVYEQALHAVFRSRNGGDSGSWTTRVDNTDPVKLNTLILTNPIIASLEDCGTGDPNGWSPMGWYCNVIAVDPVDPDIVWAAGVDLFRSDNGGRSWNVASYWWADRDDPSFVHADQHAVVFHPDYDGLTNTTMYSASDGGVFRTRNPRATIGGNRNAVCDPFWSNVQFEDLNHNMGITQFYHGAPFPGGDSYLGGAQDNGTLLGSDHLGGDGWLHINGGDGGYVAVDPEHPEIIYAESQRLGFRKSINGGLSFESAVDGVTEPPNNFLFITPFAMDPNDPQRLWTGGHRLWRTDNGAASWTAASSEPLGTAQVSAIAIAPGNSRLVLVGTTDGWIYREEDALAADGNTRWQAVRPRAGFVSSLSFDPIDTSIVYATFAGFGGNHVWRSEDAGLSWETIDGNGATAIPDIPVHSLVVDPENTERLYIGSDLGVFTSLNRGRTWAAENTGFANAVTEWLALGADGDGEPLLFAFTHGRGTWRVRLAPLPPAPREPSGRRSP